METFQETHELALRITEEELKKRWKAAGGKWYNLKTDPDDAIANKHYDDLEKNFLNEELHQKYWEEDDWLNLWDHATSNEGYRPMEW